MRHGGDDVRDVEFLQLGIAVRQGEGFTEKDVVHDAHELVGFGVVVASQQT